MYSPPSLQTLILNSVQETSQEYRNTLASSYPFATYDWYAYGEAMYIDDTPYDICINSAGEPIARATFWLKRNEPIPLVSGIGRKVLRSMFRRWLLLICKTPFGSQSGLILPKDEKLADSSLTLIKRTIEQIAQQESVSFVLFDYMDKDHMQVKGSALIDVPDSDTRLNIVWNDFDSYRVSLRKSIQKDMRRHMNRAHDLSIEFSTTKRIDDMDRAISLIQSVSERHNSEFDRATQNAHLMQRRWIRAIIDGKLVDCGLLITDGKVGGLGFLGLDYEVKYIYFQLVYTAISTAIELGIKTLYGGSGAYDFKQQLGFELEVNNHSQVMPCLRILKALSNPFVV